MKETNKGGGFRYYFTEKFLGGGALRVSDYGADFYYVQMDDIRIRLSINHMQHTPI